VQHPPLTSVDGSWCTPRLRLEAVGPVKAADMRLVHQGDAVWPWYGSEKPAPGEIEQRAASMGESWRLHGVHKWIVYDRVSGQVVGRGGLSRTPVDDDWGQLSAHLRAEPWVRVTYEGRRPYAAHAHLGGAWMGAAPRLPGSRLRLRDRPCRSGVRFRHPQDASGGVVHRAARRAVTRRHGTHRHAVRGGDPQPRRQEGVDGEPDDAPYAVCVLLRSAWQ
jgi:hypothetical protein